MAQPFPIFLSIVFVVRNQAEQVEPVLRQSIEFLQNTVNDFELIVVDNASTDSTLSILKDLTLEIGGLPNLQIYSLIKQADLDTATWVGLENALGDFIAVVDPLVDDIEFLGEMLSSAISGADVVFAQNKYKGLNGPLYNLVRGLFNSTYKKLSGISLGNDSPNFRVLSKQLVNFILQHSQPSLAYRHLPTSSGFPRKNLSYKSAPKYSPKKKNLIESIDLGMRLLVSTTRAPMRIATTLCVFGAVTNLLYSVYVVFIALFKADVASGWVSLSLQQSGMFFLLSLVLLVLSEYILQMSALTNGGPAYHIGKEFTSAQITRHQKLNIEAVTEELDSAEQNFIKHANDEQ